MEKNKEAVNLGRRGGQKTKSKYGNTHFKRIALISAEKRKKVEVILK